MANIFHPLVSNSPIIPTAHAGRLYSCVPVGTAICHVKEGS